MVTSLNLLADAPGEYPGFSSMFSGDGFSDMRFIAKAVPAADFEAWIKEVRGAGSALDAAGYAALAKPSTAVPPTTYPSVEADLFQHIIDQTISGTGQAGKGAACCQSVQQAGG
jgi:cytochrome o ubiquinol oxidase subunit 2